MKSNKLWSIVIMLVFAFSSAVVFSSCNKDDDENIQDTTNKYTEMLVGAWINYWDESKSMYDSYTFKNDGTGIYDKMGYTEEFKWSLDGNKLVIEDDAYEYRIEFINNNTLKISTKKPHKNDWQTYTYTRM